MMATTVRRTLGARSRLLAIMSYLGILCFVPILMNRDDEYVYFHAKQGLVIWTWSILAIFALHVPGIGKWLFSISALAVVAYSAVGLVSVVLNRAWKLPFVHSVATHI